MAAAAFVPRSTFALSLNIPRSYYLGHHGAALREITQRLTSSSIGLIIECRDYRVPISSWNPHLERAIAGRDRIIVYTHYDLGTDSPGVTDVLRRYKAGGNIRSVFWRKDRSSTTTSLLSEIRDIAAAADSLTGLRALVVGMPNVGKSTLLNTLRSSGLQKSSRPARVGAQPGITRKFATPIRILGGRESPDGSGDALGQGVYLLDTPGIFMPHVEKAEDMVKLALAGSVKDELIPMEILADYLLYRINLLDPSLYAQYSKPTNEVNDLLTGVARTTGKLKAGGVPNTDAAADWVVKQWRAGRLGRFVLDEVTDDAMRARGHERDSGGALSLNQARKREKAMRKERATAKRSAA